MKNQVLSSWEAENQKMNKFLAEVSDEQLAKQIAPGKNTGVYLLGHLIGANDFMLPLFGIGEQMHPELADTFLRNPDSANLPKPTTETLRKMWADQVATLTTHFNTLSAEDWNARHTKVSEEDFAKEPHRNKQNVLQTRLLHQVYHFGQLVLLK